jgi:hypothetical protein
LSYQFDSSSSIYTKSRFSHRTAFLLGTNTNDPVSLPQLWVLLASLRMPNLASQLLAAFPVVPLEPLAADWETVMFDDDQLDS